MTGDGWVQSSKEPGNAKFVADYLKMFPNNDNLVPGEAAEGYSVGQVTEAAVKANQSVDNAKIVDWLHAHKVATVQGEIGWDALGRPNGSYLLEQWLNGVIHVVAPNGDPNKDADPSYPKPNW